jgi:kinesin family member 22
MSHKVKIAARLRPRLPGMRPALPTLPLALTKSIGEVDDGGLQVIHANDGTGSHISVPNPRDVSQVFKFPFVYAEHFRDRWH